MLDELSRYSTPEMSAVWDLDNKFGYWKRVEIEAARAQDAPEKALQQMVGAPHPMARQVAEEEQRTRHDVVAFLNVWRSGMGEAGRSWVHRGMTSSDVVDTANALRLSVSADVIQRRLIWLKKRVGDLSVRNRYVVRIGRTHGQSAEVTTWGWTLAKFFFAIGRAEQRLDRLRDMYSVGKLSGPVGDYKTIDPAAELIALTRLGLHGQRATSQIVMRDAYVDYLHSLSQIASVIESMALEVRLSSRSDTGEVAEAFAASQRGSSAMPHKRNPITAEKLSGLARLVRAQVEPVAQGIATHHDRDISHSSVERVALELASQLTDYMIDTAGNLMQYLLVNEDRMRANVESSPDLLSSRLKDRLVEAGVEPATAYDVVKLAFDMQRNVGSLMTLWSALDEAWHQHVVDEKVGRGWTPNFEDMIKSMQDPQEQLGATDVVYGEILDMLSR